MNAKHMKKSSEPTAASLREMPEVRDWSKARRNPYLAHVGVRHIDTDLEKEFPDSASVNEALRVVLAMRQLLAPGRTRKSKKRAA